MTEPRADAPRPSELRIVLVVGSGSVPFGCGDATRIEGRGVRLRLWPPSLHRPPELRLELLEGDELPDLAARVRGATFIVSIEIEALDRSRLLRDIAQVLSENHVSIRSSSSQTSADRVARMRFDFEMADPGHLESVLKAIKRVDSVYDAYRMLPGHAKA